MGSHAADVYDTRGTARLSTGDLEGAIADFDAALQLNPKDVFALANRAGAWFKSREYESAIADHTQAIALEPTAAAYNNRGYAQAQLREFDKAVADYNAALKLDPKDMVPLWNRIAVRMEQRKFDKVVKDLTIVLRREPDNTYALQQRALLLSACPDAELRDGKKAVTDATRLCELTSHANANALGVLAAAYAESGNFKKAIEWQTKALEMLADEALRARFANNLKLYKKHKPYRLQSDEADNIIPAAAEIPAETSPGPRR
jgi:tetratricopeptide (TPR) repeat protein